MLARRIATIENTINLQIPDLGDKYQILLNICINKDANNIHNIKQFENKNSTNFNLIIFDLSKDGLLNKNNYFKENTSTESSTSLIVHMNISNLLLKRNKITFEDLLLYSLDESDRCFLNNFENYRGSNFAFFDNYSTINNCLVTTFQIMEKFYVFITENNICLGNDKLLLIEPQFHENENLSNDFFTQNSDKDINLIASRKKSIKRTKLFPKLTLNLSNDKNNIASKADVFIDSLKGNSIKYDHNSITDYFKLSSFTQIQSLNNNDCTGASQINNKLKEKIPCWLWSIIENFNQFDTINNILDKFNILENLEQLRLRQCFFNSSKNLNFSSDQQNTSLNGEHDFRTAVQVKAAVNINLNSNSNNNKNIYSLSNLQKEFHTIKKFNKKIQNLQLNIPNNTINEELSNDNKNENNHSISAKKDNKNNIIHSASSASSSSSSSVDILYTPSFDYNIGRAIQSFNKNRYSNILPYEHSRVKIFCDNDTFTNEQKFQDGIDACPKIGSNDIDKNDKIINKSRDNLQKVENSATNETEMIDDYFNANYLTFPQINNNFHYIATQAPLPTTINDFWKTVWNENVKIIVSLNSFDELKLRKWDIYWDDTNITYTKDFQIKVIDCWENLVQQGLTLRIFQVEKKHSNQSSLYEDSEKKIIYQLQYVDWLDSCGIHIKNFLSIYKIKCQLLYNAEEFLSKLNSGTSKPNINPEKLPLSFSKEPDRLPILVHCSAGCGRTGVFVTLDYLVSIFQNEKINDNRIDIWNIEDDLIFIVVNELRKQRISMVQTLTQYISCYDIMIEYFALINKE